MRVYSEHKAEARARHRSGQEEPDGEIDCPNCDSTVPIMATAYGNRGWCLSCDSRWTQTHEEMASGIWILEGGGV